MADTVSALLEVAGLLEKKVFPVGTVHDWGGKRYRKVSPGKWAPMPAAGVSGAKGSRVAFEVDHLRPGPNILHKKLVGKLLKHGHFSLVSGGRNMEDPKEAKMPEDHKLFDRRHESLRSDLNKLRMPYTEAIGHYGGKEHSFVVFHDDVPWEHRKMNGGQKSFMVHHRKTSEHDVIRKLGKKYNQQSVIHSKGGAHEVHYVTGEAAGKFASGAGHRFIPHAKDFYTRIPTKGGTTKFSLKLDFDHKRPFVQALHKTLFGPLLRAAGGLREV